MPFRETPEEWAKRIGRGELSQEHLDHLESQIHDYIAARMKVPAEFMVRIAETLIEKLPAEGKEVDFIGNWWIEGNPYKGLNCVILDHEEYRKSEVQIHTEESARLAAENHPDYEIFRDPDQALERRQAAFDRMVDRFSNVAHPPGIEKIGTPIRAARPTPEPEPVDPRAEIMARAKAVAEEMGAQVEPIYPEYPDKLRYLLDTGRKELSHRHYRTALREFDQLIAEFGDDPEVWSRRGVANAVVNSGIALERLGRLDEALERFDRVIEQAADDEAIWQEASYAERFKSEAIERHRPGDR